jgi:hypothetical protein
MTKKELDDAIRDLMNRASNSAVADIHPLASLGVLKWERESIQKDKADLVDYLALKLEELSQLQKIIVDEYDKRFEPREGKTMSVQGMLVDLLDMIGD